MQRSGKDRSKYKLITQDDEVVTYKRRNFALISGVTCVALVALYLIIAAYPSRLFSEQLSPAPFESKKAVHPALPASPLKSSTEELFAGTTKIMTRLFAQMGKTYTPPTLQLYEDTISAYECAQVMPASGPFYCSAGKEVFIDLNFLKTIKTFDTVAGNRTQAYIIAHQVGHHIEDLLGVTAQINTAMANVNDTEARALNLKAELLADYYAGVWAHYAFKTNFDDGDAEMAISDVTRACSLLTQKDNASVPDSYNYINLVNRADMFYRGYLSGDLKHNSVFKPGELQ